MKRIFNTLWTSTEYHVSFETHKFADDTVTWWETWGYNYDMRNMDWAIFERLFHETFFNVNHCRALEKEFKALNQGNNNEILQPTHGSIVVLLS